MRQLLVIFDGDFVGSLEVIEDGDTNSLSCCVVGRREAEVNGVHLFSLVTDKDKKLARIFAPGKSFLSSLTFASNTPYTPSGRPQGPVL
jgi:hypothetical protein